MLEAKSELSAVESAKKAAAELLINEYVKDGYVIGVGTGKSSQYALAQLAHRVKSENLRVFCIPTSIPSRDLILNYKLPLSELSIHPEVDIAFDGADEVDANLNCLKSTGGVHTQEKCVASCSKQWVFIGDSSKRSDKLGEKYRGGVAVEVLPIIYVPVLNKLRKLNGALNATLRLAKSKAGPVVTDHGNFIIDVGFGVIDNPGMLASTIIEIPGVVEHSIFSGLCSMALFGETDGTVSIVKKNSD